MVIYIKFKGQNTETEYDANDGNSITYVDSYDLGYYLPYNSITNPIGYQLNEWDNRKAGLMLNAINYVGMQIVDKGKFDINKDGIIDYCTFVVSNMSTWSDLLWPTCSKI